jgi:hypothetical protein
MRKGSRILEATSVAAGFWIGAGVVIAAGLWVFSVTDNLGLGFLVWAGGFAAWFWIYLNLFGQKRRQ